MCPTRRIESPEPGDTAADVLAPGDVNLRSGDSDGATNGELNGVEYELEVLA